MDKRFKWLATCEYPRGVERFKFIFDRKEAAYSMADAYERDGFFNIKVLRIESEDAHRT